MPYRYRPKGNRTPVNHPVIGHLSYDGLYDHPDCATNPDFEYFKEPADEPSEPGGDQAPADIQNSEPSDKRTGAGKSGRSKT